MFGRLFKKNKPAQKDDIPKRQQFTRDALEMCDNPPEIVGNIDTTSRTWAHIESYCRQQISILRADNDNRYDFDATNRIRGRIEAYKDILRFNPKYRPKEFKPVPVDDRDLGGLF